MKATSFKKFQKHTLGQNVRIQKLYIDRAKMDPKSIIAYVNQRLQIQLELLMMSGVPLETR
jgi:hypothetical protein